MLPVNHSCEQLNRLWQHPDYDRRKSVGVINRRHLGVGGRRSTENGGAKANSYVDIYETTLVLKALLLVVLSTLDAALTQILIAAGASELNGFVGYMLGDANGMFVPMKVGVTGLAAIFLVIHHNFVIYRVLRVRTILRALVLVYAALVLYECSLLGLYVFV